MPYLFARNGNPYSDPMGLGDVKARIRANGRKWGERHRFRTRAEGWSDPASLRWTLRRVIRHLRRTEYGDVVRVAHGTKREKGEVVYLVKKVRPELPLRTPPWSDDYLQQVNERVRKVAYAAYAWDPGVDCLGTQVCKMVTGTSVWSQHCLAGDTEVLTREGPMPISKLADLGSAEVLTRDPRASTLRGSWVTAPFRSYGEDDVSAIRLTMWGREKVIKATPAHRWFVRRGMRGKQTIHEVRTAELHEGDQLVNVMPRHLTRIAPSPYGIVAGLVFGDGHRESSSAQGSAVRLWGEKDRAMLRYFPAGLRTTQKRTPAGVTGVEVAGLPRSFKDRPPLSESSAYLAGWLAGYIAADGNVSHDGALTLASIHRDDLEFVRVVAARLGIATRSPRAGGVGGYGTNPQWVLHFIGATVPEWLILHESHRANMHPGQRVACWTVASVEPAGREEVYCATVPGTGAFALADWILTGNSYGNAIDLAFRVPPPTGFDLATQDDLAAYLVAHAEELEIQTLIHRDRRWLRPIGWGDYSGVYHTHIHVDCYPPGTGIPPCA